MYSFNARHIRMIIDHASLARHNLEGGGVYTFIACHSRMTIDHASLERQGVLFFDIQRTGALQNQ